jgi:peptidyl-prolyl cis-trans isomerase C
MENKIIAAVDGRNITEADLNNLMKNLGQNAAYFQGAEGRKKLVNELVMQELIYSNAIENGMDNDEEFISGLMRMKKSLLQQFGLRKVFNGITVSDDEVKKYFEANRDNYASEEMVRASHILVDTEEKANEILEDITDGLSFEEAARNYSSCPSSQSGGDLGQFGRGQMVMEFDEKVFSMKVGEISGPVKTQFGYHLIKLTDYTPEGNSSLDDIFEEVKKDCFMDKQQKTLADKRTEFENKYKVEMFE